MIRTAFRSLALLSLIAWAAPAAAEDTFTLGIMNDQSGPYADLAGPSSVQAMRLAIEDFGGTLLGKRIELLVADHQNKVDIGTAIAREWYEMRGVEAIFQQAAPSIVSSPESTYSYWLTSRSSRSSKLKSVPKKRVDRSCSAIRRSRSIAGVHIH